MNENKTNINWYPGHMAKTKREIIEDLKLIDIIVEILDARIPKSSQNPDVEIYSRDKKRIIVLNKADLADDSVTKKWQEYFELRGSTAIQMQANIAKGSEKIINAIKEEAKEIQEKYEKKGRTGYQIKVMVLGIPNVGKSTFINGLAKRKAVNAENRPGVTKKKQWIKIDENIELMDTPGMLWPKLGDSNVELNLAFTNSISENAIDKEEISYNLLRFLMKNYPKNLSKRYNIMENFEFMDVLAVRDSIARNRGAILSGNRIDERKVSDIILTDFQSGKLGKISLEKTI